MQLADLEQLVQEAQKEEAALSLLKQRLYSVFSKAECMGHSLLLPLAAYSELVSQWMNGCMNE